MTITISGAGLTGPFLSLLLNQMGHEVDLYESRADSRQLNQGAGRSINLALSYRGMKALTSLQDADLLSEGVGMKGRFIHPKSGNGFSIPYGRHQSQQLWSYSRLRLHQRLIEKCEKESDITIHFQEKITSINPQQKSFSTSTKTDSSFPYDVLIGCDGSHSVTRSSLFRFFQEHVAADCVNKEIPLDYGYKEFTIPPLTNGQFALEKHALHIWPRQSFMLIALPNFDGSFTCTLFLPLKQLTSLTHPHEVEQFLLTEFPDTKQYCELWVEEFFSRPLGLLSSIQCYPWHYKDQILLLGDAAHGIVPFYGQGLNACLEDCMILRDLWKKNPDQLLQVFSHFQEKRKRETEAIRLMAIHNFIEMRDHTADPEFLLYKSLEQKLMSLFPQDFFSQYYLVTFTDVPYDYAQRVGDKQKSLIQTFIQEQRIKQGQQGRQDQQLSLEKIAMSDYELLLNHYLEWETHHLPSSFKENLKSFV